MTLLPLIQRTLASIAFCSLVFLSLGIQTALAQNSKRSVTGTVVDTTSSPLAGATVVALQQADSVLVSYGVTRKDGTFQLRRVPMGSYILQVTFVGYASNTKSVVVANEDVDVGTLTLSEDVSELDELVISAEHIPMLISGDTLEYNASAFYTRPNANVEELLKRLPGVEVERDGSIKAQGETVRKVLVDGKEFFGDDPKIATQNLPAEAVDKVQVYDKKSDMAEFTGIDDGDESKTINLELKDDHKAGYFGDVTAGFGDDTRYDGKVNLNRFSPGTQLSVIGNVNNINRQSFAFSDYISFMGGMSALMSGGSLQLDGSIPLGGDISDGFSTTSSGGVNFSHDFGSKTELSSSYFLNHIDNDQQRDVLQQQLIGATTSSLVSQNSDQGSKNLNHRLNFNLKQTFREGQDLRLRANLNASDASLDNNSVRQSLNASDVLENQSRSTYLSDGRNFGGDASLVYRQRLADNGRSLIAEARANLNDSDRDGDLASTNEYYQGGDLLSTEEIAQLQSQVGNTFTQSQKLSFVEPIGLKRSVELHAERRSVSEDEDKSVYDKVDGSNVLNLDLSSAFNRTYTYLLGGFNLRHGDDRLNLSVGLDLQGSNLEGEILERSTTISNNYLYALPRASLGYEFRQGRNLNLRYDASTREPSMRDLQPFIDNSDPLNTYQGNPNLKPQYSHNLSVHFMYFDQFTFTNFFAFARTSYTKDAIVRSRTIDDQLRQASTVVNADGAWTSNANLSFGTPIRSLGTKINLSDDVLFSRGTEYINGDENATNTIRNGVDLKLENRNKRFFDVAAGAKYTFNVNRYSLNPGLDQNYLNRSFYADLSYNPTELWSISAGLDLRVYSQEVFGEGQNVPLWRAEIARTLLKERAQIKLVGVDLLNRNVGVNYTNSGSYIQEERINSLGRYVMLKFVYNLRGISKQGNMVVKMH